MQPIGPPGLAARPSGSPHRPSHEVIAATDAYGSYQLTTRDSRRDISQNPAFSVGSYMPDLIREERFILRIGTEEHVLRVQQLVLGDARWPDEWRVNVPASHGLKAKLCYGSTAEQAAASAAEHLLSGLNLTLRSVQEQHDSQPYTSGA